MTGCGNCYSVSRSLCVTYSTVSYVIIAACLFTLGSNVVFYNGVACGVTGCGNCLLSGESLTTYGAVLTFGKTGLSTGRSLCGVDNLGVTECVGMIVNIVVTAY